MRVGDARKSRLHQAATAARIGMWDLNVATGQVVADPTVIAMFGGAGAGMSWDATADFFDRIHPDDRAVTTALMETALRDCAALETPYRVVWPDGSVRHLLSRGQAYPGPDGTAVRLVGAITDITAVHEQTEARLATLAAMASLVAVAEALGQADTEMSVLDVVTGLGVQTLGADGAILTLRAASDRRVGELRLPVRVLTTSYFEQQLRADVAELPPDFPLPMVDVARSGHLLHLPDRKAAVRLFPAAHDIYARAKTEASAAAPLLVADRLLGSLSVAWAQPRSFSSEDVELLASLAVLCAQALDRIEARDAERAGAKAAASMSEALQRSLLTSPPQLEHLEIAVRYQAAAEQAQVGGDLHDGFLAADGGSTWLVIGDVTGHDQTAAALMGQLRAMLRATAYAVPGGPAAVFEQLERTAAGVGLDALATAVLVQIDHELATVGHKMVWCNAGHLPPLVRRADGAVEVLETSADLMLGVDVGQARQDLAATLRPGDTLVLVTDGLVEQRGSDIDAGVQRLRRTLEQLDLPVEALADELLRKLLPTGGEDDVALVIVRARDPAHGSRLRRP